MDEREERESRADAFLPLLMSYTLLATSLGHLSVYTLINHYSSGPHPRPTSLRWNDSRPARGACRSFGAGHTRDDGWNMDPSSNCAGGVYEADNRVGAAGHGHGVSLGASRCGHLLTPTHTRRTWQWITSCVYTFSTLIATSCPPCRHRLESFAPRARLRRLGSRLPGACCQGGLARSLTAGCGSHDSSPLRYGDKAALAADLGEPEIDWMATQRGVIRKIRRQSPRAALTDDRVVQEW